ncbi:MAG: RNA polymerase sigma-70 factor (ECF subfamily) [Pirellulaceae bacterium]|jgi:RNA polymerase sigma-70 factor (ECF subfamily)
MGSPKSRYDFDGILRSTQRRIRAYIAGMGIAAYEVDDVAQDVYVEFYKNIRKVPDDVEPERWLKGIARNICLNYIRKNARRGRLHREAITSLLAAAEESQSSQLHGGPIHTALDNCFEKLPEKNKQLLQMKYEKDLPSETIAAQLQKTAEAIRVSLHRIRANLRECIRRSQEQAEARWR